MKKQKRKLVLTVVLVLVAVVAKLWQVKDDHTVPSPDGSIRGLEAGQFVDQFTPVSTSGRGYELLTNCRLITGRNSDGDSFHVKHSKGEGEFRLYFVDAPESAFKTYRPGEDNGKRLDQQAKSLELPDREAAIRIGKQAKAFTLSVLKAKPFKVLTKHKLVFRGPREYALAIVEWEGKDVYLHELLVAHGLVRIHTEGADLPSGRGWKQQKAYLRQWEKKVRAKGIGAWGL